MPVVFKYLVVSQFTNQLSDGCSIYRNIDPLLYLQVTLEPFIAILSCDLFVLSITYCFIIRKDTMVVWGGLRRNIYIQQ